MSYSDQFTEEQMNAASEALSDCAEAQLVQSVVCPPLRPFHRPPWTPKLIDQCPQCGEIHAVGTEHPNWRR